MQLIKVRDFVLIGSVYKQAEFVTPVSNLDLLHIKCRILLCKKVQMNYEIKGYSL